MACPTKCIATPTVPAAATLNDVNRNGPIRYRLNRGGPNGSVTFGDEMTVTGITKLSTEGNFGLEGAFEAFPGVIDRLRRRRRGILGRRLLQRRQRRRPARLRQRWSGVVQPPRQRRHPDLRAGQRQHSCAIQDATASTDLPQGVQDIQTQAPGREPAGRHRPPVDGPVRRHGLDQRPGDAEADQAGSSLDGVRVAIQQNATEVAAANLLGPGSQAFTSPIVRTVATGDAALLPRWLGERRSQRRGRYGAPRSPIARSMV